MPDIKINLTVVEAFKVYTRIAGLRHGDKTFKAPRQKFLRAISNAWPELEAETPRTPAEEKALHAEPAREVVFTSEQQKAVSEGLLSVMMDPGTADAVVTQIFREAKTLRIKGRLESVFFAEGCGPMEAPLDGEDVSVDADDEIEIIQGQR